MKPEKPSRGTSGLMVFGVCFAFIFSFLYALDGSALDWPAWRGFILVAIATIFLFAVLEFVLYFAAASLVIGFFYFYFANPEVALDMKETARVFGSEFCDRLPISAQQVPVYTWMCLHN